ncbi:hypothetical protein RRG08_048524 [Elysia crispata]|uniref:Uncharacterized protein n=1 Tax=Elysia crispata TaxID=231223 RepID=A0AAE1E9X0_9GAST|nr:hypothetical protein RRG08_048524 [Elysia crispata]
MAMRFFFNKDTRAFLEQTASFVCHAMVSCDTDWAEYCHVPTRDSDNPVPSLTVMLSVVTWSRLGHAASLASIRLSVLINP